MNGSTRTAAAFGLALLVGVSCSSGPRDEIPPSVVLITIDTLRSDHVGGKESAMPNLDRFSAQGTVFENATSVMPITRPSHFSMLTGLYPRQHGALNQKTPLHPKHETLAEIFSDNGYRTGAFVGVKILNEKSGVTQGFEAFAGPQVERQRGAGAIVEQAIHWLKDLSPAEPFFLWVHVFDPHPPYDHESSRAAPQGGGAENGVNSLGFELIRKIAGDNGGDFPASMLDRALDLYRGDVEYADREVGKLLKALDGLRSPSELVVLVTADHGECFEKGIYFNHMDCLFDGALHVPFVIRAPDRINAGERRRVQVSGIDVAPTLLRAAGLEIPKSISGVPVQDLSESKPRYVLVQAPVFSASEAAKRMKAKTRLRSVAGDPIVLADMQKERVALVGPGWKLVRQMGGESPIDRFFSMVPSVDIEGNPEMSAGAQLSARLDEILQRFPLEQAASLEPADPRLLESLRALGYAE